jgi:hypothetical protein
MSDDTADGGLIDIRESGLSGLRDDFGGSSFDLALGRILNSQAEGLFSFSAII